METKIYLVRHGDVHNPNDVVYGRLPRFGLSALGRHQAARAAEVLAGEQILAIYTSPRLRARQTAAAIAIHHSSARLHTTALLDEIRTSWQGSAATALGKYFNFYEPQQKPTDETIADVFARLRRLVNKLRQRHRGGRVVCVSHGDPIIAARTGYSGLPLTFENLRQDYPERASLTILTFDNERPLPRIRYLNPS